MKRPFGIFLMLYAGLLAGWMVYALAGHALAHLIAERFGKMLLRLGQGKFDDPVWFVRYRLQEMLWMTTVTILLATGHWLCSALLRRRYPQANWRGIVNGALGFVSLNLWTGAAMNTVLFWGVLGMGAGVQNLMQFHFKRILLEENHTPVRVVLMGNSQTRAEINEELLNQLTGTNFWTTELHFPGSHGYDVLLLEDQIEKANPQIVICYLTEGYFYTGSIGEVPPNFLDWKDLPELWKLGGEHHLSGNEMFSGLLGNICPIFRCRQVFAQRLFGSATGQLKQMQYDTALAPDLHQRAREKRSGFQITADSAFQKRAFEAFIARCQAAHRQVILLEGGCNPVLEQALNPAIRADMLDYLAALQQRHPNVVLVPPSDLPLQTPADYDDLDHVNEAMQHRFTVHLAKILKQIENKNLAGISSAKVKSVD